MSSLTFSNFVDKVNPDKAKFFPILLYTLYLYMYIKLEIASPLSNTVMNYKSSEMCFPIFSFTRTILFAHCTTSGENTRGIQESNDNAPATVCRGTNGFGLQVRTTRRRLAWCISCVVSCAENRSPLRSELSSMGMHSVSRLAAMARGPTTMVVDNVGRSGPLGMRALLWKARNTSVEIQWFLCDPVAP